MREFGGTLDIIGMPSLSRNLMQVIWKVLGLRCKRYSILSNFFIINSIKLKKWFWKEKLVQ
jgi:hypothetical protein